MRKDINIPKVEGVQIAIARHPSKTDGYDWYVYILNHNPFDLETVLITSKGYGKDEKGFEQKTSTLRHLIPKLKHKSFHKVERIDPNIFHLCSEYWVSYYIGETILDKKFIFLPESIVEKNIIRIEMLETEGILHS